MNKQTFFKIAISALFIIGIICFIWQFIVTTQRPNIILITLDALRPDHLGCYGYTRNTSPHIDDFAKNSNLYLNCFSPGTWTIPANYSLLTSLYLRQHNMDSYDSILDNRIPTIFSILHDYGYAQRFFSNHGLLIKNFKESFGRIVDQYVPNAHLVTDSALHWIKRQRPPFFCWIYYLEPHWPYSSPSPYNNLYKYPKGVQLPIIKVDKSYQGGWDCIPDVAAQKDIHDVNYYIAQYDGQIRYADEEVGKLFSELKKLGLFDKSLIILTSDHGESLGEHHLYLNHVWTLFNEVIKIPLLIKMPSQRQGSKIEENVCSIDILPTILSKARIKNFQNFEGISLYGKLDKESGFFAFANKSMYCFIYDNWKLIKYPSFHDSTTEYIKIFFPEYGSQYYQLFNIQRDPAELVDLKNTDVPQFNKLLLEISQKAKRMKPIAKNAGSFNLSEEEKEKLRSLGYVQ